MCMIVSFTLHTPSYLLVQLLTTSLVKMIVGFDPFTTKIPSPEKTKTLMEGSRSVSVMRLKEQTFTVFPVCVCVYNSLTWCCPFSSPQPWTARVC